MNVPEGSVHGFGGIGSNSSPGQENEYTNLMARFRAAVRPVYILTFGLAVFLVSVANLHHTSSTQAIAMTFKVPSPAQAHVVQQKRVHSANTTVIATVENSLPEGEVDNKADYFVYGEIDSARSSSNHEQGTALRCRRSFEPICPIYSYVRFWNKEFESDDCFRSPASHPLGLAAPPLERKYLVFEPDRGGWNNIRMAAETAMIFAHASGRILVMPPEAHWYLLDKNVEHEENHSDFNDFFDLRKVAESLDVISMEQFLLETAVPGYLNVSFPGLTRSSKHFGMSARQFCDQGPEHLWKYLHQACFVRHWEPGKFHVGFHLQSKHARPKSGNEMLRGVTSTSAGAYDFNDHVSFLPFPKKKDDERQRLHASHDRTLIPYDAAMHAHRAIFFPGDYTTHTRILTHFYTYIFWQEHRVEHQYKRFVRDRLHYHDEIFCAAGRVIQLIHEEAAKLSESSVYPEHRYSVPSAANADSQTLGGNVHRDATYYAYHVRRGDFQYKETKISAAEIYANTKHLLHANRTRLIYVSTDEKDEKFFNDLRGKVSDYPGGIHLRHHHGLDQGHVFHLRFLRHYIQKANLGHGQLSQNRIGMIEQVVCANAHTFFGTPLSTFTGYITRMRGYYKDNRYERTYYTSTNQLYSLHERTEIVGPFWAREFAVAHAGIDDDNVEAPMKAGKEREEHEEDKDDNVGITVSRADAGAGAGAGAGAAEVDAKLDDDWSLTDRKAVQSAPKASSKKGG